MNIGEKKKLTGWLILLMVILGLGSVNGIAKEITRVRQLYEPYFSQYPSLAKAVLFYQCVLFGSACSALYTVWILFQRVPGTLFLARRAFVMTLVLRVIAVWSFDLLAGLPRAGRDSIGRSIIYSLIIAAYGAVWYCTGPSNGGRDCP